MCDHIFDVKEKNVQTRRIIKNQAFINEIPRFWHADYSSLAQEKIYICINYPEMVNALLTRQSLRANAAA